MPWVKTIPAQPLKVSYISRSQFCPLFSPYLFIGLCAQLTSPSTSGSIIFQVYNMYIIVLLYLCFLTVRTSNQYIKIAIEVDTYKIRKQEANII